ncbi:hypothetical protein PCNPT3_08830 [Psychromonas sp. CNPT3]|uniref:hypothetical protein n=1 Tax=Psychromonas sp. CNPT3 TaxID=314282 RepID=UPI00006E767A|nr:hypothetical protein [Psychromonas sp. CNPT3]AGH81704.1 hypothetical protein PCNPT3_08830 [Psychromonas sp. CNPT3]
MVNFKKISVLSCAVLPLLASASAYAEESAYWADFSDPLAIYSKVGIAAGSEGVDIIASYGSYLAGEYKQKLTVQAKHDLEYYTVDYLVLNSSNDTGFVMESQWGRDERNWHDSNRVAVGLIKRLPLLEEHVTLYPSLKIGFLWGDNLDDTTYVATDVAVRYAITDAAWIGATPSYIYAMKGEDLRDWSFTAEIGYQFVEGFSVAGHVNDDEEYWADINFAF